MEPRVTSVETKIQGRTYSIAKMDPRTACWLFTFLASRTGEGGKLTAALGSCTRAEFDQIQTAALKQVTRLDIKEDKTFPVPVLMADGRLVDKDLLESPQHVMFLTSEAIMFNLTPFLGEADQTDQP